MQLLAMAMARWVFVRGMMWPHRLEQLSDEKRRMPLPMQKKQL
jgi:hypothetical protein